MPFSRNALPDLSSGPDNEKKRTPRAFWQASACSVRVMHAVCAESLWGKSWEGVEREREGEYLSVVKQGGSIVPELIRAWHEKRKRERERRERGKKENNRR